MIKSSGEVLIETLKKIVNEYEKAGILPSERTIKKIEEAIADFEYERDNSDEG